MISLGRTDDTAPCVGCGLCCNGALYLRAKVTPGEESRLIEHGLTLMADREKTYFELPCHYESCGRCKIYEARFDICRSFRCALLRRYQAGEISLEEAKAIVANALRLLEKATALEPSASLTVERAKCRRQLAFEVSSPDEPEKSEKATRLLSIIALDAYLDRWFRNRKGVVAAD